MRSLSTALVRVALTCVGIVTIATTTALAQTETVWVNISQGTELLATVAAKPLAELRREGIAPGAGPGSDSRGLSMMRIVRMAVQTSVRVPAAPLDHNTPLTADGFMVRCWKSNGTAYIQVSSITGDPATGERETPLATFAVPPGESRELREATSLGAAPLTIAAASGSGSTMALASRKH